MHQKMTKKKKVNKLRLYPLYSWEQDGRRRLSKEDTECIKLLYSQGVGICEIARRFGATTATVYRWADRENWLKAQRIREARYRATGQKRRSAIARKRARDKKIRLFPEARKCANKYHKAWIKRHPNYQKEWLEKHPEYKQYMKEHGKKRRKKSKENLAKKG